MAFMTRTIALLGMALIAAASPISIVNGADVDPPRVTATQNFLACVKALSSDSKFAEISTKLPLQDVNSVSFNMLADQSRPTAQEREEIAEWFDQREGCWKANEAAIQTEWPPEIVQVASEGSSGFKAIGVDLYNRKLTYGEANLRIQELGNNIKARIIPIVKQYQAEIGAQKAAAEQQAANRQEAAERRASQQEAYAQAQANQEQALRQQRAQLFLNYMGAMRQQQQQIQQQYAPKPTYTTNCSTSGNMTNCTTR
jgi:hypothetical protein